MSTCTVEDRESVLLSTLALTYLEFLNTTTDRNLTTTTGIVSKYYNLFSVHEVSAGKDRRGHLSLPFPPSMLPPLPPFMLLVSLYSPPPHSMHIH